MKVNLSVNKPALSGYINLDPAGGEGKYQALFDDIEKFAGDAQCTEILGDDTLDFVSVDKIKELVTLFIKKLRHGGRLILGGTDLYSVCQDIFNGKINTREANYLLHGEHKNQWDFRHCQISLLDLCDLFEKLGLKLNKKRVDGYKMIVEGERI